MNSKIEDAGPCTKKVSVTVSADAVKKEVERAWGELKNTVSIPGFRKGKAPRQLLEKRFSAHVMEDVKREVVGQGIEQATKEHQLEVVAYPELDIDDKKIEANADFAFDFIVEVKPTFELPVYKGLVGKRHVETVDDKKIDGVIERLRERMASIVPVEGAAEDKDYVIGKFTLSAGGKVEFEKDAYPVQIGVETEIDGVTIPEDKRLLGLKAGDVLEWTAVLPETFEIAPLRGKTVDAKFAVNDVKRVAKAEIAEVVSAYEANDEAGLRAKIRQQLESDTQAHGMRHLEEDLVTKLIEATPFDLPPTVVARTTRARTEQRFQSMYMQHSYRHGNPDEAAVNAMLQEATEGVGPSAERSIRTWYIVERIAKKEKLFATESDVQKKIEDMALRSKKTPTQVREQLLKDGDIDSLRMEILEQKVLDLLKEHAQIVDEACDHHHH